MSSFVALVAVGFFALSMWSTWPEFESIAFFLMLSAILIALYDKEVDDAEN